MTLRPARTTFRTSWRQKFVLPLPASPCKRVMHPSSTPPPRRSSRARQPRATFIFPTTAWPPLILHGTRRKARQIDAFVGPHDHAAGGIRIRPWRDRTFSPVDRMDGHRLPRFEPCEPRLEALCVDPPRPADLLRFETSRFSRAEISEDDERPNGHDLSQDTFVPLDVPLLERGESHEGRDPVDLAALLLAVQFRRGRHGPAE